MRRSHYLKIDVALRTYLSREQHEQPQEVIVLCRGPRAAGPIARNFDLHLSGESVSFLAIEATAEEIGALARDTGVLAIAANESFACWDDAGTASLSPSNDRVVSRYREALPPDADGSGVRLVVVDTGISAHRDLPRAIRGVDVTGEDDTRDHHGHGTFIAGQLVAGGPYPGLVPGVELMIVRVFDREGRTSRSRVLKALDVARLWPAHVVSLSLGGRMRDPITELMVRGLAEDGIVVVAAAGNAGPSPNTVHYPAGYKDVIAVGACDFDGRIATFSSRGTPGQNLEKPDLVAEGVGIVSLASPDGSMGAPVSGGYARASGTSFSCPIIAAVSALVKQRSPRAHPKQVRQTIKEMCEPLLAVSRTKKR